MTTRLKGRQMDYLGDVPAFLQDMKDGEIRVATDGVYARFGSQIRKLNYDALAVSTTTTTTTTMTTTSTASTISTSSTAPIIP